MPRKPRIAASARKTFIIPGPKRIFLACPVAGSLRASSGGARWNVTWRSPSKLRRKRLGKGAVRIEPRDLVFVLDRHQLEEIARDRLGERYAPRRARAFGATERPRRFGDSAPRSARFDRRSGTLRAARRRRRGFGPRALTALAARGTASGMTGRRTPRGPNRRRRGSSAIASPLSLMARRSVSALSGT